MLSDRFNLEDVCETCSAIMSHDSEVIILAAEKGLEDEGLLLSIDWVHDTCWLAKSLAEKRQLLRTRIKEQGYTAIIKNGSDKHFLDAQIKRMDKEAKADSRLRFLHV